MADLAHKATDKAIAKLENRLFNLFNDAAAGMIEKQERTMAEYEQLQKQLTVQYAEKKITKQQYEKFLSTKALTSDWYNNMITSLAYDAMQADMAAATIINGTLPETYALNYNFATYQIEKSSKINTSFTLYDKNTVLRLLKDNPDLYATATVNVVKDMAWNKQKIAGAVLQGITQGDSIPDIAARITKVIDMDYNAAKRTARTAMTSAQNNGRLDSYDRAQRLGINGKKRWLATLDDRTRDTHALLDGETVGIHEPFSNGLEYPGDESTGDPAEYMNCRCTLIYEFEGTNYDDAERYSDIGHRSYEEWLDMHRENLEGKNGGR